jgi:hypothetical protein
VQTANTSANPFSLFAVDCCFALCFHSTHSPSKTLALMLIVAWSTADGFEQPRLKVIVMSSLFTSFSSVSTFGPVDCHIPFSSHRLDYQSNRIEVERGWLLRSLYPFSHHMLCRNTSSPTIIVHRPRLCFVHRGCFVGPPIKSTASVATEAATGVLGVLGGSGGHRPTIRRPSRTWFRCVSGCLVRKNNVDVSVTFVWVGGHKRWIHKVI